MIIFPGRVKPDPSIKPLSPFARILQDRSILMRVGNDSLGNGMLLQCLWIAIISISCISAEPEGKVIKVVDGDTFDVLQGKETLRIRLFGIDSPERGQAFNRKAKEYTESIIAGKTVRLIVRNKDRYGRSVAQAYLMNGTYINAEIVKAGFAWHFKRYSDDPEIERLEQDARNAGRGLWADPKPTAPWDFRKKKQSI